MRLLRLLLAIVPGLVLCACQATGAARGSSDPARAEIIELLDELYAAFCFDAEAEPDWETQRRLYMEGATFVPPADPERAAVGESTERFLAGFREYATSGEFREHGFHERILDVHVDLFGRIAHAFVAFEGFFPGDGATVTRGVDGIQLVKDGQHWRLVSFTTQYETDGAQVGEHFPR